MVTQAKYEVIKTNRAHRLADQMNSVENQRTKEREDDLARRRRIAREEADALNKVTLKQHDKDRAHSIDTKARFGR